MLFFIYRTFVIRYDSLLFMFGIRNSLFQYAIRYSYLKFVIHMRDSKFFSNNTLCAVTNNDLWSVHNSKIYSKRLKSLR